jgi:hypothetical protein
MDPTPRRWFHASQEDSMKQFEQLTSHVAVRSGIILVATLMVFAVLSPAGRRVGVLALAATLVGVASTTVAAAENSDTAIRPFKVKVPEAAARGTPPPDRRHAVARAGAGAGCIAGSAARDEAETRALLSDGLRLAQV